MLFKTRTPEQTTTVEIDIGKDRVTKANATLSSDREYASLSQSGTLSHAYYHTYWIGVQSKEIAPRVPKGQTYEGRTFEGVPSISGYFVDNKDKTFTKLQDRSHAVWQNRLFVSPSAAAKVAMKEAPVRLFIGDEVFYDCRLIVSSGDRDGHNEAHITSVPKNQDGRIVNLPIPVPKEVVTTSVPKNQDSRVADVPIPIPKEIINAARQEYDSQIGNNATMAADAFPAYKALLEHAERQ